MWCDQKLKKKKGIYVHRVFESLRFEGVNNHCIAYDCSSLSTPLSLFSGALITTDLPQLSSHPGKNNFLLHPLSYPWCCLHRCTDFTISLQKQRAWLSELEKFVVFFFAIISRDLNLSKTMPVHLEPVFSMIIFLHYMNNMFLYNNL